MMRVLTDMVKTTYVTSGGLQKGKFSMIIFSMAKEVCSSVPETFPSAFHVVEKTGKVKITL